MRDNVPKNPKLWEQILDLGRGKSKKPVTHKGKTVNPVNDGDGFTTWPSAYGVGWALAQYDRLGGEWETKKTKKSKKSNYKEPRKWSESHCKSKSCDDMGFSEKASCRPYKDCYMGKKAYSRQHMVYNVADRYIKLATKRDDPKKKNTGHGGLDTWFSGHGGGVKDKDKATWGDWVAITPVKHTITKENGEKKTYEAGDIVGLCAVSSTKEWASVTSNGKKPLKCMPRSKAYQMPKKDRASLARIKRKEENKHRGKKPVNTPTFSDEAKKKLKKNK